MTHTKNIPDKAQSVLDQLFQRLGRRMPTGGFFFLVFVLGLLSALASTNFSAGGKLFLAGEIATEDVTADQGFLFEDGAATRAKREQVRSLEPLVLDLVPKAADEMREGLTALFLALNQAGDQEEKERVRARLADRLGEEVSLQTVEVLAASATQSAVTEKLLPVLDDYLRDGVLTDMRAVLPYKGGVLIRNLETGEAKLFSETNSLHDLKSLELRLSQEIKELDLAPQAKKTLNQFFETVLRASLVPNYEATASRAAAAEAAVQPVIHKVNRGETLIRKGEIVTPEDQLKMQTLLKRTNDRFSPSKFFGVALCALLLACGVLFSPSNKPVSRMENRDYVFLALQVAAFALVAKGFSLLSLQLASSSATFSATSLAYAVPVAGAAGLSSLIFSARRFVVNGLLISLFCTLMTGGGIGLFLFYFMACMWSTWLTGRTYSRHDVVKTFLPLLLGLYVMWAASTLMEGGPHTRYMTEAFAILAHAVFSMLLTFAIAPVIELVFGYTTRFKLMELLNLEQPLLRELMLSAPGTYHHSLIVSNMVEAGANAVGAHSLLCKVAALYHDIGKISKAAYFIENQNAEENPHDKLAPSMSALILISHVKQGTELAEQHRLGREVIDIIRQHHGSGLIRYFYQKAQQQPDTAPPKEADFCYPGPKPQSREAALVMLADAVEASSRTLEEPTPHRLHQHADTIIKNIYATGQLDETDLTFRDLNRLAESFARVLRGIFHHRIHYPEKPEKPVPKIGLPKVQERQGQNAPHYSPYSYGTSSHGLAHQMKEVEDSKKDEFKAAPVLTIPQ